MDKKRILYLSNVEVPYRALFFYELSKHCDLTVLYERRMSSNRDGTWVNSENKAYKKEYIDGVSIGRESSFSIRILSILKRRWDIVLVGCYNTKVQMLAIIAMRIMNIPYVVNLDGEAFINNSVKGIIKKYFLKGAKAYLTAGEQSSRSLCNVLGDDIICIPYYFSSLNESEIKKHSSTDHIRGNYVLVVGQYFNYKGMDIAFKIACIDKSIKYVFVGMGNRTKLFCKNMGVIPKNIEIIPFLQKKDLEEKYKECSMLLLPSRQECWGLVVNEAASFGTPIVSTWGSGAAVEFLANEYPQYLAKPGNVKSLYQCVKHCLETDNRDYSDFLKRKAMRYSIEKSVQGHLKILDIV